MPPRKRAKKNTGEAVPVRAPDVTKPVSASAPAPKKAPAVSTAKKAAAVPTEKKAVTAPDLKSVSGAPEPSGVKAVSASAPVAKKHPTPASASVAADAKGGKKGSSVPEKEPEKAGVKRKARAPRLPIFEDVWREVFLAGTEWDQLADVGKIDWDFEHLDDALNEEGELEGKPVHLFGATEPQLLMKDEKDTRGSVISVPVIVAVVSSRPPPATIGIKSVQRAEEEIIPMAQLKMGWHPHTPENVETMRRYRPNVHVLKCETRRARLRNMNEAAVHKYDYVLPYIIRPGQEEDITLDTNVQVLADLEGLKVPLMCEYDFELDDLEEFVEKEIEENELDTKKHTEALKTAIKETVRATKLKYKAEREARKKRIDDIPKEDRLAIQNMKLYKFYPANEWPDVSGIKARFINRYYGQADKIL